MTIRKGKSIKHFILVLLFALCAIFPCAILFSNDFVSAKGGVYVEEGGEVNITGGNLATNSVAITLEKGDYVIKDTVISGSGNGAIILAADSSLRLENCVIENNSKDGNGGAIYVGTNSSLVVDDCKISGNSADGNGGAIYASENSRVSLIGTTTITENKAVYGGGIYLADGAVLNDGLTGLEYFSNNTATYSSNVWQDVHYKNISLNLEQEYVEKDGTFKTIINDMLTTDKISVYVPSFGVGEYSWLKNSKVIDMSKISSSSAKSCEINDWEGLNNVSMFGETKLVYTLNSDGVSYNVKARSTEIAGTINIRSTYKDLPVTRITNSGFKDCVNLTGSLVIPDSMIFVGQQAFKGCS